MKNVQLNKPPGTIDRLVDWFDERFQVRQLIDRALHVHIPKKSKTFYLGGMTLFMFGIQGITGALLALYYQPTPETAYESVLFITSNVNFKKLCNWFCICGSDFEFYSVISRRNKMSQGAGKYF